MYQSKNLPKADIVEALDAAGIAWFWEYPGCIVIPVAGGYSLWTGINGYGYATVLDSSGNAVGDSVAPVAGDADVDATGEQWVASAYGFSAAVDLLGAST